MQQADEIDTVLSQFTAPLTKEQAAQVLQGVGVAAGAVNTAPDMLADPHVQQRGFFVPYERFDTPMPGNPIHMAGLDSNAWQPCPSLGAHNHEVLETWLALATDEIDRLLSAGVLLDQPPD